MISDKKQQILKFTIKGTMKKEQNKNEYKPKNQFEALIINQFTNINNSLGNIETRLDRVETRLENVEADINQMKNTPTMKKELN